VGGQKVLRFSGRVVAATNRPEAELLRGSFREDFYYRLSSDVIVVPPLRQRIAEDRRELPELVRVILARITGGGDVDTLARTVDQAIERDLPPRYPWPGNVRELEQCVRRVLLTGRYVGQPLAASASGEDAALLEVAGDATAKGLAERYVRALYARHGSYEEVARRSGLDRRTVKAYVTAKA
jgi:transcriptional regulator with PAS, ATPase and Fis domain